MQHLWITLLDNVVFLTFLMPTIGAGLVLASSQGGSGLIRRIAFTNAALTLALALLMAANFDDRKPTNRGATAAFQMTTSLRWVGNAGPAEGAASATSTKTDGSQLTGSQLTGKGIDVRLSVGVDGVSLWLIVSTALIMIPVLIAAGDSDDKQPAVFHALLLLLESAAIGVFAALDVILFYICLEVSVLLVFLLIGQWGGRQRPERPLVGGCQPPGWSSRLSGGRQCRTTLWAVPVPAAAGFSRRWTRERLFPPASETAAGGRRQAAARLLIYNLAGSLLCLMGLTALVLAHGWMSSAESTEGFLPITFSIPELTNHIPVLLARDAAAEQYWLQVSPWICLALLVGFAVKMPVFPFHTWLPAANNQAPHAVSIFVLGVILNFGFYGWLRFVVPLFGDLMGGMSVAVTGVATVGIIYASLLALAHDDVKQTIAYTRISHGCLCAAGILSLSRMGAIGSVLLLVGDGLTLALLVVLIRFRERREQDHVAEPPAGKTFDNPRFRFVFLFAVLSLIAVPGFAVFTGQILILLELFRVSQLQAIGALCGSLLLAWSLLLTARRVLTGALGEPSSPVAAAGGHASVLSSPPDVPVEPGSTVSGVFTTRPEQPGPFPAKRRETRSDLPAEECLALTPLMLAILWLGVSPQFFVSRVEPSIAKLLASPAVSRPAGQAALQVTGSGLKGRRSAAVSHPARQAAIQASGDDVD